MQGYGQNNQLSPDEYNVFFKEVLSGQPIFDSTTNKATDLTERYLKYGTTENVLPESKKLLDSHLIGLVADNVRGSAAQRTSLVGSVFFHEKNPIDNAYSRLLKSLDAPGLMQFAVDRDEKLKSLSPETSEYKQVKMSLEILLDSLPGLLSNLKVKDSDEVGNVAPLSDVDRADSPVSEINLNANPTWKDVQVTLAKHLEDPSAPTLKERHFWVSRPSS